MNNLLQQRRVVNLFSTVEREPNENRSVQFLEYHPAGRDTDTLREQRQCWICLATEDETSNVVWLHPCRCRGSNKWVHEICLNHWIDEEQMGDLDVAVYCSQCLTKYIIVIPPPSYIDRLLYCIQFYGDHVYPPLMLGFIVTGIYFIAVTFGAISVLQVFGYEEGIALLGSHRIPTLLVALPCITSGLLMGYSVHWNDMVLRFLCNIHYRLQRIFRSRSVNASIEASQSFEYPNREHLIYPIHGRGNPNPNSNEYIIRTINHFVGALILPTCATIVGKIFYKIIKKPVNRSLLGGLTFILIRGTTNIYLRYCYFIHSNNRRILNYTDQNQSL